MGWEAKDFADRSNLELGKAPIEVKGQKIRAACETSLDRRIAVKAFYTAKDIVGELNKTYGFTVCPRSLSIYDTTGLVRIGSGSATSRNGGGAQAQRRHAASVRPSTSRHPCRRPARTQSPPPTRTCSPTPSSSRWARTAARMRTRGRNEQETEKSKEAKQRKLGRHASM